MPITHADEQMMRRAIAAAREGIAKGQSPFGALVACGDRVVVCTHNVVRLTTDITAHAEVHAIRQACLELGRLDLGDCVMYATCEPCPMCFSACHWARLPRIVYGATIADAHAAGFNELRVSNDQLKEWGRLGVEIVGGCMRQEAAALFGDWLSRPGSKPY
jgi:tRNA(Arg) A34 adenosine deaminase TadA